MFMFSVLRRYRCGKHYAEEIATYVYHVVGTSNVVHNKDRQTDRQIEKREKGELMAVSFKNSSLIAKH